MSRRYQNSAIDKLVVGISTSTPLTTSSGGIVANIPSITYTDTSGAGTIINIVFSGIQQSTLTALTDRSTINVITQYIGGAPIKGINESFTNAYGLYIDSASTISAAVTQAASLYIANAPIVISGTTYALQVAAGISFLGGNLVIAGGATSSGSGAIDFSGNSGIFKTSTGAVTIGSGAVSITGTTTFSAATTAILASGSGAINFSGNSGIFKTSTGAVTIGSGAVSITGTTTFSAATTAILASGSGAIDFSGNSGTFKTSTGAFTISGPLYQNIQSLSTTTSLSATTGAQFIVATSGTFTITLPTIYNVASFGTSTIEYYMVNNGTGAVTVSVSTSSNESFDGNTAYTFLTLNQNDRIHLISYSNGTTTGYWYTF